MKKLISLIVFLLLAGQLVAADGSRDKAAGQANIAAARWLVRHQHADGHWSSHDYTSQCSHPKGPCKIHSQKSEVTGTAGNDVAVTALALLGFSGLGHTHRSGEYPEFVESTRKALKWLMKQQNRNSTSDALGSFGTQGTGEKARSSAFVYNQAIATMALSEMLLISGDKEFLGESVRLAANWCLKNQSITDGGWGYSSQGKSDCSVSGWMVIALKNSRACATTKLISLNSKSMSLKFKLAAKFFRERSNNKTHLVEYSATKKKSSSNAREASQPYAYSKKMPTITAVALVAQLFLGESRRAKSLVEARSVVAKFPPRWQKPNAISASSIDLCYWYFASYGLFQMGGPTWETWRGQMYSALLPGKADGEGQRQAKENCEHGSWDPIGRWGAAGGRVYSTALAMLTLEIFFRFRRVPK